MNDTLKAESVNVKDQYISVDQTLISITQDKLKLILVLHLKKLESNRNWLGFFGVFLSLLSVFFTTDFAGNQYLDAAVIKAIYLILTVVFGSLTVWAFLTRLNSESLADLMTRIKNGDDS